MTTTSTREPGDAGRSASRSPTSPTSWWRRRARRAGSSPNSASDDAGEHDLAELRSRPRPRRGDRDDEPERRRREHDRDEERVADRLDRLQRERDDRPRARATTTNASQIVPTRPRSRAGSISSPARKRRNASPRSERTMTGRSSSSQPSPDGPTIDADEDLARDRRQPQPRREVHQDRREHRDRGDDEDRAERDRRVAERDRRPRPRRASAPGEAKPGRPSGGGALRSRHVVHRRIHRSATRRDLRHGQSVRGRHATAVLRRARGRAGRVLDRRPRLRDRADHVRARRGRATG